MADRLQEVRVEIYDRLYALRSESEEKYARRLAKLVDGKMRSIAEKTQTIDSLELAVLAALHFADECERLSERYQKLNGAVAEKSIEFRQVLEDAARKAG
ncbi:MAG: cell division protein ZapA [Acidobacteriota bacterium]